MPAALRRDGRKMTFHFRVQVRNDVMIIERKINSFALRADKRIDPIVGIHFFDRSSRFLDSYDKVRESYKFALPFVTYRNTRCRSAICVGLCSQHHIIGLFDRSLE